MNAKELVEASRVTPLLEPARRGRWIVERHVLPELPKPWLREAFGLAPGELYTVLRTARFGCMTDPEVVMEDSRRELRRHLPILLPARGRVLVSGFGLGCVLRGLLAKPEVEHVDVIEKDPDVLDLALGALSGRNASRCTVHLGDALSLEIAGSWDFAWHDIWSEDDKLDLLHVELFDRFRRRARFQGAWQLDRQVRRVLRERGFPLLEGLRPADQRQPAL